MVLVADMINVKRVHFSLNGHEHRVNSVSWLSKDILVAVSDRIVIYEGNGIDGANWKIKQVIITQTKEQINYLSVLDGVNCDYICTISNDGVLNLYENSDKDFKPKA
jgi:hypothetical protein